MTDKNIPVLGGEAVTRDEGFAAWLAMNDYLLECEFLVFDVSDMPEDPYSEEGLRVAEAEALKRFDSIDAVRTPENRETFDKFVRFIGEAFVKGLGFQWTNRPKSHDDGKAYLAVEMPAIDTQLEVARLLTAAVHRRTGEEWAFVYRSMRTRRDAALHSE